MPGPRRLVEWPWVVLRVECEPCRYSAGYRIARLAEKYGAEASLAELLERVRAKCRLIDRGRSRRQPAWSCSIRYRVPEGGPLPDGVPAREARAGETWPPRPKREPAGRLPTIAEVRARGVTHIDLHCYAINRFGAYCHHTAKLPLDGLRLRDDAPFTHIPDLVRLTCRRCGGRKASVRAVEPDRRDPAPLVIPGVTPGARPPGTEPLP